MATWKKLVIASGSSAQYIKGDGTLGTYSTTDSSKLPLTGGTLSGKLTITPAESLELSGIRGRAVGSQTGDFIHLYERVSIGNPSGWGHANASAPQYGLSVYGSVQVGRNGSGVLQMNGTTVIDASRNITNAGNGTFSGNLTVNGSIIRRANVLTNNGIAMLTTDSNHGAMRLYNSTGTLKTQLSSGTNSYILESNLGIGTSSPTSLMHLQSNDSTTNAEVDMLTLQALSTGTTTTGFGGAIKFQAERNNGVSQNTGKIRSIAEVNSGNNISSGLSFETGTFGTLNESMRITYDGKVGIGMIPTGALDIQATDNLKLRFYTGTTFKAGFESVTSAGNMIATSAVNDFAIRSQSNLLFSAGGSTERMRIGSDGNVVIGDATPSRKFTVVNTTTNTATGFFYTNAVHTGVDTHSVVSIRSDNASSNGDVLHVQGDGTGNLLTLSKDGSDKLTVTHDGNVGIGNTSPASALTIDVADGQNKKALHITQNDAGEWTSKMDTSGYGLLVRSTANDTTPVIQVQGNGTSNNILYCLANGQVGINTNDPSRGQSTPISDVKLGVLGNQMFSNLSTTNTDQSKLFFFRSDGAVASQGAVPSGLKMGAIEWDALTSGDNNNSIASARIETVASNTWSSASVRNAHIAFSTIGANTLNERMRLTSTGLAIGTIPTHNLNVYNGSGASSMTVGKYASGKTVGVIGTSADTSGYFQIQSYASQGSTFGNIVLNAQGGNVGIGTSSPAVLAHFLSSSANQVRIERTTAGNSALHYKNTGEDWYSGVTSSNNFSISRNADIASGTEFVIRGNTANIGIGIANPAEKLHVNGGHLEVQNSGNTNVIINSASGSDGSVYFQEGGGMKARVFNDASANALVLTDGADNNTLFLYGQAVGIGTSTPTVGKLQVNHTTDAIIGITRTAGATSGNLGTVRFGNTNIDSSLVNITAYQDGATTAGGLKFQTQASGAQTADALTLGSDKSATFSGNINMTADKFLNVGGSVSKNSNIGSTAHGITIQDANAPTLSLWDTTNAGYHSHFYQVEGNSGIRSSGSLTISTNAGTTALTIDSSQNATFAGDIAPVTNNGGGTLGTSSKAWSGIWTTGISTSGNITVGNAVVFNAGNNLSNSGGVIRSTGDFEVLKGSPLIRVKDSTNSVRGFMSVSSGVVKMGGSDNNNVEIQSNGTTRLTIASGGGATFFSSATIRGVVTTGNKILIGHSGVTSTGNYDKMELEYTGYNSGNPRLYITPDTNPGSGITYSYVHIRNKIGGAGANKMGLMVDYDIRAGVAVTPITNNTGSLGYTGLAWNKAYVNQLWSTGGGSWSSSRRILYADGSGVNIQNIDNNTTDAIRFRSYADAELVTILDGGNVGIGTTSPSTKLEVSSGGADVTTIKASYSSTNYLEFSHNKINAVSSGGNDSIFFQTAGTTRLTLSNTTATFAGNVRLPNSGKLYLWNDHSSNYLSYNKWQASVSTGMTIANTSGSGSLILKSGNSTALTLDSSQNATFAGDLDASSGQSLTGWHTQDKIWVMPSDFMVNDDNSYYNIAMEDNGGQIKAMTSSLEAYINIPIPSGYKATHYRINGTASVQVSSYYSDCTTGTATVAQPTAYYTNNEGAFSSAIEANDTTGKYVILKWIPTDSSKKLYGGYVKIAKI